MTNSPGTPSDAELLGRMMAGDEEAFTTLYRRRQSGVFRFALQMTGSRTVAEDVTQDVFIVLIREGGRFDPERGSLASFLYGIARNNLLRRFEQERRYVGLEDNSDNGVPLNEILAGENDPQADLISKEVTEKVRTAVLSLPSRYREVVVLCDLHEFSYEEAAAIVGCAIGTVRSRLHRARGMLIEKLKVMNPQRSSEPLKPARCFA